MKFSEKDIERFNSSWVLEPNTGCWLWTKSLLQTGYGQFWKKDHTKNACAHRFSWVIYRGPIPKSKLVLHKCDVRACVNPDHLYLGNHFDNNRDTVLRGRRNNSNCPYGDNHYRSKFTDKQIVEIRKLSSQYTLRCLAKKFNVDHKTIRNICIRKTWKHID